MRVTTALIAITAALAAGSTSFAGNLNRELTEALGQAGFTGRAGEGLVRRLGRPVDQHLAGIGRLLFFDKILSLHSDNSCAGCHSPTHGFGDSQPVAIGIGSNDVVGPRRRGPRNQRRSPMLINDAFFPKLMWNGRFSAPSGDPFDSRRGFRFPEPEGDKMFPPGQPGITHLLQAQAFIPPTELTESAGFTGTAATIEPARLAIFDDGKGQALPEPDRTGSRNEPIRLAVLARLNATKGYRELFGGEIDYPMVARALAEFQFTLVFSDAPLDRFARGRHEAMSESQKRGALLFFGKGRCDVCHAVSGTAGEMFSDFELHNAGVPQIAPYFGLNLSNVIFDGPGEDEDFGLEQVTEKRADRYLFRTAPLRNLALAPAYFHNGAFARLQDALEQHLDPAEWAPRYNAFLAGAPPDLMHRLGPIAPVLATLDPKLAAPVRLTGPEFDDLVEFLREGLLDPRARPERLCALIPKAVPGGLPLQKFQGCK